MKFHGKQRPHDLPDEPCLEFEITIPGTVASDDASAYVVEFVQLTDRLYRALGGDGLELVDLQIEEPTGTNDGRHGPPVSG